MDKKTILMKIIKLDETNPYSYQLYETLNEMFFFAAEYLPWIFLKKVYLDGEMFELPRLITKKHWDSIDGYTQNLMHLLNWEKTEEDKINELMNAGEDDKGNPIF
jgi:hypothetical protein